LRRFVQHRLDRKLNSRVDASDVVQEAQLEAFRRLDGYLTQPPGPFHLWLRRIAFDRLLMLHRRHRRAEKRTVDREIPLSEREVSPAGQPFASDDSTPSQHAVRVELTERIRDALQHLAPADREILQLRIDQGLSNQEVAQRLGVPTNAATKRYGRALIRLQQYLSEETRGA
jgi:RNA polymerase sigma-70 factor (ECF subfamily)